MSCDILQLIYLYFDMTKTISLYLATLKIVKKVSSLKKVFFRSNLQLFYSHSTFKLQKY